MPMIGAPEPLRPPARTRPTMQVVAVRIDHGGEDDLAAVLVPLAGQGGLVIVQAIPATACGDQANALLSAIHAELSSHASTVLLSGRPRRPGWSSSPNRTGGPSSRSLPSRRQTPCRPPACYATSWAPETSRWPNS
jgi:hypothetical protein